jgi:5'-nucleotidase
MAPPRILITNDDGILSPGLRWLARTTAEAGYDVTVAAPAEEASGSSAALSAYTADGRVIVVRHSLDELAEVPAYGVAASPGYIVVLAVLGAFGQPPDLVLSGINRGANAGRAVLHSGTVGAAFTAAGHGRPAMAVSLDVLSPLNTGDRGHPSADATTGGNAMAILDAADDEARNWQTAADLARDVLAELVEAPDGTVLNLNVPDLPAHRVLGVRQATLARFGQVQMAIAETGEDFVRTAVEQSRDRAEPGTDLALLSEGYATLTPIRPVHELVDAEPPAAEAGQHART